LSNLKLRLTLHKKERLNKKSIIDKLFAKGKSFSYGNFYVKWDYTDNISFSPAQILFNASKKKIKSAVKRNIIKRLIKECYRKNKYIIYKALEKNNKNIAIVIIYNGSKIIDYEEVNKNVLSILNKISDINENIDK